MDPDAAAVPYDEFLALARDEGLIALDVQVVQAPGDANGRCAVVQATARTAQGSFAAVGEASALSAPVEWHPFLTTLAEFRAKARALRDLTGLEHTIQEELSAPYHQWQGESDEADSPTWRQPPANGAAARATSAPTARPSTVVTPSSARPAPTVEEEDEVEDDDMPAGDEAPSYSAPRAAPDAQAERDDAPDDGFDAIGRDMEAKLLKMAMSIASLEGSDISESDARQKLDDFFMRAFKHPLSKATRLEGQRVVQRLSSDLARLRTTGGEDKD